MNDHGLDMARASSYNGMWEARENARDQQNERESWQAELADLRDEIRQCRNCRPTKFGQPRGECAHHIRELADHYHYRP